MFVMVLVAVPSVFAQSNSVTLTGLSCPTTVYTSGSLTVHWTTASSEPNNVAIFVNAFNNTTFATDVALLGAARSGSAYCNWLEYGNTYFFYLDTGVDSNLDFNTGSTVAGANAC